jgi:putative aldouronate transport system permease protein
MKRATTAFDVANATFLVLLGVLTLYPFWYVLVMSISTEKAFYLDTLHIVPRSFSLATYAYALTNPAIMRSALVSVCVTVAGDATAMALTSLGAYVLSKRHLVGRNVIFRLIIFTMFFSGGLIPWYIVVSRVLHLKDTILALFLPNAVSTFNLILMKNYFLSVPESLEESAKLDGASEIAVLVRIVLPVSKPIVATVLLFYSVFFWNDWFSAMLFVSSARLSPLPLVLRNLILSTTNFVAQGLQRQVPDMIRAAVIIISIVPIMAVYPVIQRYFVQGIMLGSVKE